MPKVTMPQLGESVAEGTIGKWLKNVGDHVDKYEPIVEVITDKVNAEVPSPFEGTLTEILVKEGDTVPNNTEIAVIEGAGAEAATESGAGDAPGGAAEQDEPTILGKGKPTDGGGGPSGGGTGPAGSDETRERAEPTPVASPASLAPAPAVSATTAVATEPAAKPAAATNGAGDVDGYTGRMTPAVRRMAREHGVDLSAIEGTGHGGRVTRDDIMRFVESGGAAAAAAQGPPGAARAQPTDAQAQPAGAQAQPAPRTAPAAPAALTADELKPQSPMRKAIAAQMTKALSVPVAYTVIEIDMSGVVGLRNSTRADYQAREGISLTYDAIVAKATVDALKRNADFNAHYTDEGHWRRQAINLGVAVAVDDGLVVPVIKNADTLSVHGLNQQIRDLAERARGGKLKLDDIQGGTFTLDNTGWTGSIITQPIINSPEVGILTMESIVKRPVVIETANGDLLGIRPMMYMCLGFDHRATDGAQAGRFVADVKRWLEAVDSNTAIW